MKLGVILLGALAGVDAQADLSKNPCAGSQFKQVWCDSSRSIEDRVTALVANMGKTGRCDEKKNTAFPCQSCSASARVTDQWLISALAPPNVAWGSLPLGLGLLARPSCSA